MNDVATNILEVSDLCVDYASTTSFGVTGAPSVRAVKGISLTLQRGETLSLVGESGCRQIHHGHGHTTTDAAERRPGRVRRTRYHGLQSSPDATAKA